MKLERVGPYKILDRLGSGGVGELYRAVDTRLGRTVAVRAARAAISGDPSQREQFLLDAVAAQGISHPNIATLYETIDQDGTVFVISEFVPGDSLAALIAGRPLNPRRAVDLAVQLSDALAEAHAHGIVHGDLRPDSIVVTPKGNGKILDFGLSAWTRGGAVRRAAPGLGSGAAAADLDIGSVSRTLPYLSPEQALGEQVDCRSDIFSLGSVLFEMLTGAQPFTASTPAELMGRILRAEPSPPSSLNPLLPRELDPILRKALSKRPDDRYLAAATLAAELRAVAAVLEARATSDRSVVPREQRHRRTGRWPALWLIPAGLGIASAAWLLERLLSGR